MGDLDDAYARCGSIGPAPLGMFASYSFLTATAAAITVTATFVLASILGPFLGFPGIALILSSMGLIATSPIMIGLLYNLVFVLVLSLCRLQIRFGDIDFSSLAGRHADDPRATQGSLTTQVGDELRGRLSGDFSIFPFVDGDYLYNVRPEAVTGLLSETVGGAFSTGNLAAFVQRTPGGAPATRLCDAAGNAFLHCEIDSARKWGGHIAAIVAAIAALVAAIVFYPLIAPLDAICHSVPILGPVLCAIAAALISLIVSGAAGAVGGLVGDLVDALSDPRDGVIEGTSQGWDPAHDDCVVATGIWVTDLDHGHNELHPLQSLQQCTGDLIEVTKTAGTRLMVAINTAGLRTV